MITCLACKGTKVTKYTVSDVGPTGVRRTTEHQMKCIDCDGAGTVTEAQHAKYLAFKKAMTDFWCRCGNPSQSVSYHPDEPGSKHHWTCDDCGKVTQVG